MLSDRGFKNRQFRELDGAGKARRSARSKLRLRELGVRSMVLTFWDDIVVLGAFRSSSVIRHSAEMKAVAVRKGRSLGATKTSPRRTSSRSVYCFISWTPFSPSRLPPVEKNRGRRRDL